MDGEARVCASEGCDKPAKMQCPTCLKLKLKEGSYFCAQDCFKNSWATHKAVHKAAKAKAKPVVKGPMTWPGFKFSGPLRPWPQAPRRAVPPEIQRPDYAENGEPTSERKARSESARCLSTEEIAKMRKVCIIGREVLDACARVIAPGVTCTEIDRVCHETTIANNAYPSPLNYIGFPKSCCTSVNEVICHGIPDDRPLEEGDIVNVDISVYHNGYHSDLNETFLVGKVSKATYHLVKTTHECLFKAIEQCKPGTRYRDLGNVITKHAHSQGLSVVRTYCGHGVNNLFHTAPNVPHYERNKAPGVMKPGHVFTIEPMINAGSWKDMHWPDDWTATTVDGERSAQFEHTLLITETGCEILTERLPTSPGGPVWFQDPEVVAQHEAPPPSDDTAAEPAN